MEINGKRETYYKFTFEHVGHVIEIYIYLDEAGYMLDDHFWTICERPDYSDDDELIASFTSKLKDVIHSFISSAVKEK